LPLFARRPAINFSASAQRWASNIFCAKHGRETQNVSLRNLDAIDLQHTVLGLSYCDALVIERYAFSTAEHAIKSLAPLALATIHKKLAADVISATAFLPDYTNRDISQEHDAVAPAASVVV
jgi:hypothetical protein